MVVDLLNFELAPVYQEKAKEEEIIRANSVTAGWPALIARI